MDTVAVNVDHPMASAKAGAEADWSIDNDICIVSFRQSKNDRRKFRSQTSDNMDR